MGSSRVVGLLVFPLIGSTFALSNLANFLLYVPMGLGQVA